MQKIEVATETQRVWHYQGRSKAEIKRFERFNAQVIEIIVAKGAVENNEGFLGRFKLETKGGMLLITPYGDWIACRFDDLKKAKAFVRSGTLNLYSGKWNWHGDDVIPHFERSLLELAN